MSPSRHFAFRIMIHVALASIFALSIYYWYGIYLPKQYEDFLQREHEITPLFDRLNENTAQNLPPLPPNSSIQAQGSVGMGPLNLHGRILQIEILTTHPPDFILKYYDALLLQQGWHKDAESDSVAYYSQDVSCIKIDASSLFYPNYGILIWQDYKSQTFAPEIPKDIRRFESPMTTFLKCP